MQHPADIPSGEGRENQNYRINLLFEAELKYSYNKKTLRSPEGS